MELVDFLLSLDPPVRVFCDSDGVLKDFDRHVFNTLGKWPHDMADPDMWAALNSMVDEFWSTMPKKFGADELWATILPYKPTILTGSNKDAFDQIAVHKVAHAKRDFGEDIEIITCLARNKALYVKSSRDILIDDFSRNTRRWVKAGGRAVHYRTWEQAIADFHQVIEDIRNEAVQSG